MTNERGWWLRFSAGALAAAVALSSAAASAQAPSGDSMAVAEALFRQARELVKQHQYAEACPKLAESQRLDPKLGTLLNLAVCHEKLGKTASAWAEYTSAAAIARREGQKEREDFARDQAAALEKKLARIVLVLHRDTPQPGLRLAWDDAPLDGSVLGLPFPVDPGRHRLSATAPGKRAWSALVEVPAAPGDVPVTIPPLETEAAPAPVAIAPVVPVAPPAPPPVVVPPAPALLPAPLVPVESPRHHDAMILVYTGFSVAAAGVLVGAVTGGVTLARSGALHTSCLDDHCNADQRSALSSATTIANVSNVSFGVAAAGAGVGIAGLILARSRGPKSGPATAFTPVVGPGFVGLRGAF